ncbi:hypothetical protein JTB14_028118 [Gonioctena quinquepunctata]|nr:hypothetical protein JTB14_028118 [Gonioctena quinquepunctata]
MGATSFLTDIFEHFKKLKGIGMEGTGTMVNNNRLGRNYIIKTDNNMSRGNTDSMVRDDKKLCLTKWKNNKCVEMASTAFGANEVTRWDKIQKIRSPKVLKTCDMLLECYRTFFKTKKWPIKVIHHLFDLAIVNSRMEYRRDFKKMDCCKKHEGSAGLQIGIGRIPVVWYEDTRNEK